MFTVVVGFWKLCMTAVAVWCVCDLTVCVHCNSGVCVCTLKGLIKTGRETQCALALITKQSEREERVWLAPGTATGRTLQFVCIPCDGVLLQ